MKKYDHKKIEKKWQKKWEEDGVYKTKEDPGKKKYYVLDMFPYPSGAGLHVGHPKGYIATDVIARQKMMQEYNVLHPMGWDAFGLPAENYALKNKVHPAEAVKENIATFKKQLGLLGFTYDWDREINTTDPNYYKWTQWIFIQMFKRGLAYESYEPINWCPECKTGLANEDLENGLCERCGSAVEQKPMRQWVLKITDYAERLLQDIELLKDWPEPIKEMQRNWIGRSCGAQINFDVVCSEHNEKIRNTKDTKLRNRIEVFTTRPDTLFGATYVVVAPEHPLVVQSQKFITNSDEVNQYIERAKKKTALERTELQKEKTGVELKGIRAVNPVNNEELPIFVADYVLPSYGTGAIMAVPAHDERDWEFAKKYNLPVKEVLKGGDIKESAFTGDGEHINSEFLNGLNKEDGILKMNKWLEENNLGQRKVQYKLRDWVFSRQRYWGEPIPLIKCEKCGWIPVPENELPLELPKVKKYEPTGTGESPLANIDKWVNTTCPVCGSPARRETNTMPQWAGSCWYYLAYVMRGISNLEFPISKYQEAFKYWNPIDLYVGGAEHATRHLIYARFWHKFLHDIGAVNNPEPFKRLQNVGLILAEDGRKMSKRWNNVINPNEVVEEYGADAMRLYEMFMGPFDQPCAWSTKGVVGCRRFLEKVWALKEKVSSTAVLSDQLLILFNQTIKKVGEDIAIMRFNTAIAKMMELVNELSKVASVARKYYLYLIQILAPFAPHLAEEVWQELGHNQSIFTSIWPQYDARLIISTETVLAVQINGKVRTTITVSSNITEEEVKQLALQNELVQKWMCGKEPKKIIYVKGKLVSIVV